MRFSVILAVLLMVSPVFADDRDTFHVSSGGNVHSSNTFTWTPETYGKRRIEAITVHFSGSTDEAVKVILDSKQGATYDTVVFSSATDRQDIFWQPDNDLILEKEDALKITVGTGAGAEAFAITVRGEQL